MVFLFSGRVCHTGNCSGVTVVDQVKNSVDIEDEYSLCATGKCDTGQQFIALQQRWKCANNDFLNPHNHVNSQSNSLLIFLPFGC